MRMSQLIDACTTSAAPDPDRLAAALVRSGPVLHNGMVWRAIPDADLSPFEEADPTPRPTYFYEVVSQTPDGVVRVYCADDKNFPVNWTDFHGPMAAERAQLYAQFKRATANQPTKTVVLWRDDPAECSRRLGLPLAENVEVQL